ALPVMAIERGTIAIMKTEISLERLIRVCQIELSPNRTSGRRNTHTHIGLFISHSNCFSLQVRRDKSGSKSPITTSGTDFDRLSRDLASHRHEYKCGTSDVRPFDDLLASQRQQYKL